VRDCSTAVFIYQNIFIYSRVRFAVFKQGEIL
jgi:hypothetical protein